MIYESTGKRDANFLLLHLLLSIAIALSPDNVRMLTEEGFTIFLSHGVNCYLFEYRTK